MLLYCCHKHMVLFDSTSQWHLLLLWRRKVWDALLCVIGTQWYLIKGANTTSFGYCISHLHSNHTFPLWTFNVLPHTRAVKPHWVQSCSGGAGGPHLWKSWKVRAATRNGVEGVKHRQSFRAGT